jgi:hypothetical protein
MGIVTADESRLQERGVYWPAEAPVWRIGRFCHQMGNRSFWWKWIVTTFGCLAAWFLWTALQAAESWVRLPLPAPLPLDQSTAMGYISLV